MFDECQECYGDGVCQGYSGEGDPDCRECSGSGVCDECGGSGEVYED